MRKAFAKSTHLADRSAARGQEWKAAFDAVIIERTTDGVWFDLDAASVIALRFKQASWPRVAKFLAKLARPEDRELGDVVQRLVGKVGGEKFKHVYKKMTGVDCNCGSRQERLNRLFPLQ